MSAPCSTNEKTTYLIIELTKAWNTHDLDRVAEFYAADFEGVDVAQAHPQHGPDGIRQSLSGYIQAFPDLYFVTESIITGQGQAVLVWKAHGTHLGRLMNIPPTGRSIEVHGVSILTVIDQKIKKALYIWDVAGLLRNIGLLPEL
jgi:steroid delta-isomerase-like uncharacterized protein